MLCTYKTLKIFELLSAPSVPLTLSGILQSQTIVEALMTLDPSFYFLTSTLSSSYHNKLLTMTYKSDYTVTIDILLDKIELNSPDQLDTDVTDALYTTLSWVSHLHH